MNEKEKMTKVYESIACGNDLTTKELNSCGFTSYDLTKLIKEGLLERVKRGLYKLTNVDALYHYGKKLITNKEQEKAMTCFEKCYEIDPMDERVCFQLFYKCLLQQNPDEAFKYLKSLIESEPENKNYKTDYKLYLYLFNFAYGLPDEYSNIAKNMTLEDIQIDSSDTRYSDVDEYNKTRYFILLHNFSTAKNNLDNLGKKYWKSPSDVVIRHLVGQAGREEQKSREYVLELIKNKDYERLIAYLTLKDEEKSLSHREQGILSILEKYIEIETTNTVPFFTLLESSHWKEAFEAGNFQLALELSKKHADKINLPYSNSEIVLLLEELCNLVENINVRRTGKGYMQGVNSSVDDKNEVVTAEEESQEIDLTELFQEIVNNLEYKKIDGIKEKITLYLNGIGKSEYEFFIEDLIKLGSLELNPEFLDVIVALANITLGEMELNISDYIKCFHEEILKGNLDKAQIYLDIIRKTNELQNGNLEIGSLKNRLTFAKNNNSDIETENRVEDNSTTNSSPFYEFLEEQYHDILENKDILLLDNFTTEEIKEASVIIKEHFPNMHVRALGAGVNKILLLRYINPEEIDRKGLKKLQKEMFRQKKYKKCLDLSFKILHASDSDHPSLYATIGQIYMRQAVIDAVYKKKAITYLTVATEMAKEGIGKYDFSDTINSLKNDRKYLIVEETKFVAGANGAKSDVDDSWGVNNIYDIANIMADVGVSVEKACSILGVSNEKVNVVKLLFAKACYAEGDYEKGDCYYREVEKSHNKTKHVNKFMEEINTNKRFYHHRNTKKNKSLVLMLRTANAIKA